MGAGILMMGGRRGERRGYSLMELTVSAAAASMLLAGVGSTIYVASQAAGDSGGACAPVVTGATTIEQLAADLQYAVAFTERSPNAVEFTIADRNGDAASETIRYEWSGVAGDPVTRTFNGGTPQSIAGDVHDFQLDYRVQNVTQVTSSAGSGSESAETLLASFTGWSGVNPTTAYRSLSATSWVTEYFEPAWPSEADQLKVTRVRLMMAKKNGSSEAGDYSVGIYPAAGGVGPIPNSAPLGTEQVISGAGLLSTHEWQDAVFSDVVITDSSSGYNIVVKGITSGAEVQYYTSSSAPVDTQVFKYTSSSGDLWLPSASMEYRYDAPFYVFGTYTSSTPVETTTERYFVRSVGIALQVGADADARIETGSEVLNAPEVVAP